MMFAIEIMTVLTILWAIVASAYFLPIVFVTDYAGALHKVGSHIGARIGDGLPSGIMPLVPLVVALALIAAAVMFVESLLLPLWGLILTVTLLRLVWWAWRFRSALKLYVRLAVFLAVTALVTWLFYLFPSRGEGQDIVGDIVGMWLMALVLSLLFTTLGFGVSRWIASLRKAKGSYRLGVVGLVVLWGVISAIGWVVYVQTPFYPSSMTVSGKALASDAYREEVYRDFPLNPVRWRVVDVASFKTEESYGYRVRFESFLWMGIPLRSVSVKYHNDGERVVISQNTWWKRWFT